MQATREAVLAESSIEGYQLLNLETRPDSSCVFRADLCYKDIPFARVEFLPEQSMPKIKLLLNEGLGSLSKNTEVCTDLIKDVSYIIDSIRVALPPSGYWRSFQADKMLDQAITIMTHLLLDLHALRNTVKSVASNEPDDTLIGVAIYNSILHRDLEVKASSASAESTECDAVSTFKVLGSGYASLAQARPACKGEALNYVLPKGYSLSALAVVRGNRSWHLSFSDVIEFYTP